MWINMTNDKVGVFLCRQVAFHSDISSLRLFLERFLDVVIRGLIFYWNPNLIGTSGFITGREKHLFLGSKSEEGFIPIIKGR